MANHLLLLKTVYHFFFRCADERLAVVKHRRGKLFTCVEKRLPKAVEPTLREEDDRLMRQPRICIFAAWLNAEALSIGCGGRW
jgi:hypothetical protein